MNNDPKSNVHSIYREDGILGNWQELNRCPKICTITFPHSRKTVTPIRAYSACDTHTRVLHVCYTRLLQQITVTCCLQCTLQQSEKGRIVKCKDSTHLAWLTSPAKQKAFPPTWRSNPNNNCPGWRGSTNSWHSYLLELLPLTPDNLFRQQAGIELGGIMYSPGSTKWMW